MTDVPLAPAADTPALVVRVTGVAGGAVADALVAQGVEVLASRAAAGRATASRPCRPT